MIQEFALDLRAARRNSGLRQVDCAHLMGISKTKLSNLERGLQHPSVHDICALSMIYGRSFESLFCGIFQEVRHELSTGLDTLPPLAAQYKQEHNRAKALESLHARLEEPFPQDHDM